MKPDVVLIDMPKVDRYLSMNDRDHWRTHAKRVKHWRFAAKIAAGHVGPQPPSTLAFTFDVPDRRRRDPMNYYSTIKALVDGLVDAGLWPDDTPEFVTTVEPVLRNVGRKIQRVTIVIEARP